jgi:AcrR family transcriptional regulator
MSLGRTMRREKIIAAAAILFAHQGYRGTTTREIARLAEVSENTLFRHFDHKEDIFWLALRSHASALTPRRDLLEGIRAGEAPGVVLPKIIELLADTVTFRPEVLRLIAVAVLELGGKAEMFCRDLISPLFSEISRYLAIKVKKGEVMNVDPTLLASSLMAMVLVHPHLSKMTDGINPSRADSRDTVRAYSKFWVDMLSPRLPDSLSPLAETVGQTSA